MFAISTLFQLLYSVGVLGLALYGINALWLTWLSRHRSNDASTKSANGSVAAVPLNNLAKPADEGLDQPLDQPLDPRMGQGSLEGLGDEKSRHPQVTVQLPIYNELHVVERLIDACARLEYPKEKLQIQLLDDSTDQTALIINRRVDYWRQRGVAIDIVRRETRTGYKGGALAESMQTVTGEYIAIFDADFKPPSDFLQRMIPILAAHPKAGFLQARWTHLNTDYSPLTKSQALALDGHFMIEQVARQRAGYAFGFNGSAGIWRRSCILDPAVGGWQTDTLTEDLDLSYRAQLAGWQPLFVPEIEAPAEIPPQLLAFKRQQFRWAKGSIQTLRKCGSLVWKSDWSLVKRFEALLHLGAYTLHPLLLLVLLSILPCLLLNVEPPWVLTYLTVGSVGPPILYAVAQRRLHPKDWPQRWSYIWLLTLLGFGLSLNNSTAVWEALRRKDGPFLRTPKFHVQSTKDSWHKSSYRLSAQPIFFGELLCLSYSLAAVIIAMLQGQIWMALFLLFYVGGFGLMVGVETWQFIQGRFGSVKKQIHSIPTPNQ